MGYYKNKLIEQQVELGDRVPAPKPASEHAVFYVPVESRRFARALERGHRGRMRRMWLTAGLGGLAVGVVAGVIAGLGL